MPQTIFLMFFMKFLWSSIFLLFKLIWEERIFAQLPVLFLLKFFLNHIIKIKVISLQIYLFYLLNHSGALHLQGLSRSVINEGSNNDLQWEHLKHLLWNTSPQQSIWCWSCNKGCKHLKHFFSIITQVIKWFMVLLYLWLRIKIISCTRR